MPRYPYSARQYEAGVGGFLLKQRKTLSEKQDLKNLLRSVGFFREYLEECYGKKNMVVRGGRLNCIIVVLISLGHISCINLRYD